MTSFNKQILPSLLRLLGPLIALGVVVAVFGIADQYQEFGGKFLTFSNFQRISVNTATVAVAALGMTFIIIAGGIDLSAGTGLALCATVVAYCLKADYSPLVSLGCGILMGCGCGLLNGVLISWLRMIPFIVTLGTMSIYLGIAKQIAKETTVRPDRYEQVPVWMREFLSTRDSALVAGMPLGVWVALGLAILVAIALRYTVFSRHVFALGSNEATARLCGINVTRTKIAVYTLAGFFVGIAGLFQFSRLSVGNPTSGLGMELEIIAAVVIGGGSLNGGSGTVLGTLAGAAIMSVIQSGCTQLGINNPTQDMILGGIIIVAVLVDQLRHRHGNA
ncbi:MAG: ABC transporter permease [Rubinisphaera brasiliensis]|uniref:Inner-membrane translocator n=1 Tax=Rubinisphaera brasiliensis (strain ATCC 49424 / DSM 5305 / JCM 21570 / IAM 15109 / NBRC 103401 / IFAM 1448) TaxID=756272 RepID=F0SL88_RUBBR|nr:MULTISPECIES: ABC transporter permease [Rubinisphaera]ADY60971.1 inner-membrane translocator [Rubinisphaera brasiliensis DSM 5305]MBB01518.1 ABC transporter permease [Planctomyces sp.]